MTITISIDELRGYKALCKEWAVNAAVASKKLMAEEERHMKAGHLLNIPYTEAMEDWIRRNPFPDLVPKI